MSERKIIVPAKGRGDRTDMLFGVNIEHMGRILYGGIYDANSPKSDENGFRQDVQQALRDIQFSAVRYPGGNFVSGYRWRDGIGKNRPIRLNMAWKQVEPNTLGLHEMTEYVERLDSRMMMNFNLGSGSIWDALELFEYCNFTGDTTLTRERRENGREEPFAIRYWGLGNELDGRWQTGNLCARDYALKAKETARLVKLIDPKAQTILVGSSKPLLRTFADWDREVVDIAFEQADYLSMHSYFDCPDYFTYKDKSTLEYLGVCAEVQRNIDLMASIIREAKLRKQSKHDMYISYDEWNIWHRDPAFLNENRFSGSDEWLVSDPRIECIYNFRDAVLAADMLNLLMKNSDVVKIGCICQAVNCIGLLITRDDGAMFRQTIYHPYRFAGRHMKGEYLPLDYDAGTLTSRSFGDYEQLSIAAVKTDEGYSVMAVNNDEAETMTVTLALPEDVCVTLAEMMHDDPDAVNGFDDPDAVIPHPCQAQADGNQVSFTLPPLSIVMLTMAPKEADV